MLYFPNDQLRYCGYIPFHRISSKLAEYKDWLNWGKFVVFENMTRVGNTFVIYSYSQANHCEKSKNLIMHL